MRWIAGHDNRWLYVSGDGESIAMVQPHGGSWAVHFRGEFVAIRPDRSTAMECAEGLAGQ